MLSDFRGIPLKVSYDTGEDDILWDFYVPTLSLANHYDRIAGFFSSTSLALAARGLEPFIRNGGKMRLVTCPKLSPADIAMIEKSAKGLDMYLEKQFISDLDSIEDRFKMDHVRALGWMLAKGLLEIRIAVLRKGGRLCTEQEYIDSRIMHQKVGILFDRSGNLITFSGSNNESAFGWCGNVEEFKVFCSWKPGMKDFNDADLRRFEGFWKGTRRDVEMKDLPSAVRERLIEEGRTFEPSDINVSKFYPSVKGREKIKLKPFYYQVDAMEMWEENGRQLLFQLCTGAGKTVTSICCMEKIFLDTDRALVVIACPQATLSSQWRDVLNKFEIGVDHELEINGTVTGWRGQLDKETRRLSTGYYRNLVIYVTHSIASSESFINTIESLSQRVTRCLVGDEVHGMGADKMRNGLLDCYKYRIGLSATPQRWFDDLGSRLIETYFGNKSFEFTLEDALVNINPATGLPFLVNYYYEPRFVHLTEAELAEYIRLTERLVRMSGKKDDEEYMNILQFIRFKRADVEKNAENKYRELEKVLDILGNELSDTIIFVSDDQIDRVMRILGRRGITASRFTMAQGTTPSEKYGGRTERQYIIDLFKEKEYQALVAIKCLDEGIDIPSADTAIIMASSTNPREYVQRIGRIIRQAPGKYRARIYDMIIVPDLLALHNDKLAAMEERIFRKEMDRVLDLSANALNNSTVLNTCYDVLAEVTK